MAKFIKIQGAHAINYELVKFMHISESQNEPGTDKYWVCFVFDNDLTCYAELEGEENAREYYKHICDYLLDKEFGPNWEK